MEFSVFLFGLIIASVILIILGFPVAFTLGVVSVVYLIATDFPLVMVVQNLALNVNSFTFLAIPLFMLAGILMNSSGVTDKIFDFANDVVGSIPGGLGHVNVVTSLIFAGMSGSVLADVAGPGSMEYRAMRDRGYDGDFSVGVTLGSSVIGPIFPPSIPMVLFGVVAEVSIPALFLGGVIPAFAISASLMIYIYFVSKRRRYYISKWVGWRKVCKSFIVTIPPLLTPVIIVGGMTLGIFSPTEAATVGVLWAVLLGFVVYRKLSIHEFIRVISEVTISMSKLLFVITTGLLFGWVLTVGQMPQQLAAVLTDMCSSSWQFLLVVNIVLLILGAIIENAILTLILAPMLAHIGQQNFGLDPIHLGVVMVFATMIGQYTPPMALSLFLMRDITGLPLNRVFRAVLPFLVPLIVSLMIFTHVPQTVLWLPRLFGFGF